MYVHMDNTNRHTSTHTDMSVCTSVGWDPLLFPCVFGRTLCPQGALVLDCGPVFPLRAPFMDVSLGGP